MMNKRFEWYMGSTEIIDNTTKEIIDSVEVLNDLEAKLANFEEFMKEYKFDCVENLKRFVEGANNFKQQLAEKEKKIEQLKKFDDLNKTFFDLFRSAFKEPNKIDDLFNTLKTMQEKQDQSKTTFAIQQLSLARNRINSFRYDEYKCLNKEDAIEDCLEVLDKTILEIKELESKL